MILGQDLSAIMWHKIWQDGQQVAAPLPRPRSSLADPPVIKELVRAEVKMLLENLQEKFIREGRHDEEFLSRYNEKTVNFALGRLEIRAEPEDKLRSSMNSNAEGEIEALKDKLNITDIDKVVQHLKSILTEECATLKTQVKHIQEMIKKQCRIQSESFDSEPTLAELKELRGAIQKDFQLFPSPPLHVREKAVKPPFRTAFSNHSLSTAQRSSDKSLSTLTSTSLRRPRPPSTPPHTNICGPLNLIDDSETTSRTSHQHRNASSASRHRKVRLKLVSNESVVTEPSLPVEDDSDFFWQLLTTPDSSPFFPSQYLQPG
ncbi:coiled-coil domain-containing protein 24 isoform X2 [Corythoichthys intestinalis]|uniref:coiled-coil domain-containing protein 24 isoform X2 n=1 Tax=Corythoichthys intestinalis TaxID=161448 RepID=UPI0025A4F69B|nr:coiled-coil domain-containing protein 24 isoform X2 [Corythoichthys intestinalis]